MPVDYINHYAADYSSQKDDRNEIEGSGLIEDGSLIEEYSSPTDDGSLIEECSSPTDDSSLTQDDSLSEDSELIENTNHIDYTSQIKKKLLRIENGRLFVSRDFEDPRIPRYAIDTVLHRLTKRGLIVRVTRGVFMKESSDSYRPTIQEVAIAKARAFDKEIEFLNARISLQVSDSKEANKSAYIFRATGASTSFRYGNSRITFKSTSPRRLRQIRECNAS